MATKPRILLVEDDTSLGMVVSDYLQLVGYQVSWQQDGQQAWDIFQQQAFDVCLIDIMLPSMDGFALVTAIRKINQHVPILMLTAKSFKEDKLLAFKMGIDDYIVKPFNIEELVLRIEVFLRRSKSTIVHQGEIIPLGHFRFDYSNLCLIAPSGETKQLTQKEADILHLLCQQKGNVVKKSDILLHVWGEDDFFLRRSLDVFISKLRKYLKEDESLEIQTVYGVGFKLVDGANNVGFS